MPLALELHEGCPGHCIGALLRPCRMSTMIAKAGREGKEQLAFPMLHSAQMQRSNLPIFAAPLFSRSHGQGDEGDEEGDEEGGCARRGRACDEEGHEEGDEGQEGVGDYVRSPPGPGRARPACAPGGRSLHWCAVGPIACPTPSPRLQGRPACACALFQFVGPPQLSSGG